MGEGRRVGMATGALASLVLVLALAAAPSTGETEPVADPTPTTTVLAPATTVAPTTVAPTTLPPPVTDPAPSTSTTVPAPPPDRPTTTPEVEPREGGPDPSLSLSAAPSRVRVGRTIVLRAFIDHPPPGSPPEGAEAFFYESYTKVSHGAAALNGTWVAQLPVTARRDMGQIDSGVCDDRITPYCIYASTDVEVIEGFEVSTEFFTSPPNPTAGHSVIVHVDVSAVPNTPMSGASEGGLPSPSGAVTVLSGANPIGQAELGPSGRVAIPVTLPAIVAPLSIAYEGDDLFLPFGSNQTVVPDPPADDPDPPADDPDPPPATSIPATPPAEAGAAVETDVEAVVTETTVAAPSTVPAPTEDATPEDEPAGGDDEQADDDGPAEVAAAGVATGADDPGPFAAARTDLVSALPRPGEVDWSAAHTAASVLLALLLLGAMSLSAELVNGTITDNYLRIFGATPGLRRLVEGAENGAERIPDSLLLVLGGIGAALIGMLLDRSLGWNASSLLLLVALTIVLALVNGVLELARLPYLRARAGGSAGRFGLFPFAVTLGGALVVFSRISGFEPGFLFGVTCGLVLTKAVRDADDGRSLAVSGVALIAIALVSWTAWGPLAERAADGDTGLALLFGDAVLGTLWLAALQTVVFAFIPISALAGSAVKSWSTKAWAAIWGLSVVLLVQMYIHPRNGQWGGVDSNTMRSALAVFGMLTLAAVVFWAWFRFRPDPDGSDGTEADQAVTTSG